MNLSEIDKSNMKAVLTNTPADLQKARRMYSGIALEFDLERIDNIIICGMGGSAIAGELFAALVNSGYLSGLQIPVFVNRDYSLPHFASESSLIILSSYSGNTEETLSAANEAEDITDNIVCISAGGQLTEFARENGYYSLVELPGGYQPRCAFYFPFTALLYLFDNSDFFADSLRLDGTSLLEDMLDNVEKKMTDSAKDFSDTEDSEYMKFAEKLHGKRILIYSQDGVSGVISLRIRQQIQENAKQQISGNVLPEMNHNEINSMQFPEGFNKNTVAVLLRSAVFEHPRVSLRFSALKTILKKNDIEYLEYDSPGDSLLESIIASIFDWDLISYCMAIKNNIDPTDIPDILFLKDFLAKDGK